MVYFFTIPFLHLISQGLFFHLASAQRGSHGCSLLATIASVMAGSSVGHFYGLPRHVHWGTLVLFAFLELLIHFLSDLVASHFSSCPPYPMQPLPLTGVP